MATVATTLNSGAGFASGETVTASKLNSLVNGAAVTGIVNADIDAAAAIAASKLATAAQQSLVPAGAIMAFAMNSAPSGWLAADGTAVSRSTYAALFSAVGTTHGSGDGSTTFNLPDLRGIFVRGSGSQTISGSTYSGTFAAKQQDDLKGHTHSYIDEYAGSGVHQSGGSGVALIPSQTNTSKTSGSTGGTETRPANISMLYCIKH